MGKTTLYILERSLANFIMYPSTPPAASAISKEATPLQWRQLGKASSSLPSATAPQQFHVRTLCLRKGKKMGGESLLRRHFACWLGQNFSLRFRLFTTLSSKFHLTKFLLFCLHSACILDKFVATRQGSQFVTRAVVGLVRRDGAESFANQRSHCGRFYHGLLYSPKPRVASASQGRWA